MCVLPMGRTYLYIGHSTHLLRPNPLPHLIFSCVSFLWGEIFSPFVGHVPERPLRSNIRRMRACFTRRMASLNSTMVHGTWPSAFLATCVPQSPNRMPCPTRTVWASPACIVALFFPSVNKNWPSDDGVPCGTPHGVPCGTPHGIHHAQNSAAGDTAQALPSAVFCS